MDGCDEKVHGSTACSRLVVALRLRGGRAGKKRRERQAAAGENATKEKGGTVELQAAAELAHSQESEGETGDEEVAQSKRGREREGPDSIPELAGRKEDTPAQEDGKNGKGKESEAYVLERRRRKEESRQKYEEGRDAYISHAKW